MTGPDGMLRCDLCPFRMPADDRGQRVMDAHLRYHWRAWLLRWLRRVRPEGMSPAAQGGAGRPGRACCQMG